MMEFISTSELTLLGVLTLMSIVMITFPKDAKFPLVGAFVLGMIMVIAYTNHRDHLDKEFVIKRFQEGQTIECGLWRGERTLISTNRGWKYLQGTGFIKGDFIHSDHGLCNVMNQQAPKPSSVPYLFALVVELMLVFGLRAAVQKQLKEEEGSDEPDHQ